MENVWVYVMFLIGLIIIIKGGDYFVDAAVWIANITGIPQIFIGATLVSLATTLPELLVSVIAASNGHSDMAIGNAMGSCICNIGLVLGLCTFIRPMKITGKSFSIKGLLMIVCLIIFYILSYDGRIKAYEGLILLGLLFIYMFINIMEVNMKKTYLCKNHYRSVKKHEAFIQGIKFIVGAMGIVLGGNLLVDNGVKMAHILKIPEAIVSLTLIALGTSLPEFVTSISATMKGHQGISVGNIVGANILNLTMVLGTSAISSSGLNVSHYDIKILHKSFFNISQTLVLDIPVALLLMSILVLCGIYKRSIDRKHGFLLFFIYIGYLSVLTWISF